MKGLFIVLYGINNLGKSTQAKLLVEKLQKEGKPAEYLKYPMYSLEPTGPKLNAYLREGNPENLDPKQAQTLYTQNRIDYEDELKSKLEQGTNIVAEDYVGTGIGWGVGAGVDENYLKDINKNLLKEDIAFLFEGERFKEATEDGHKHETDEGLLEKVAKAHKKLGEEYGWIFINANETIDEIHEKIWQEVKKHLS